MALTHVPKIFALSTPKKKNASETWKQTRKKCAKNQCVERMCQEFKRATNGDRKKYKKNERKLTAQYIQR